MAKAKATSKPTTGTKKAAKEPEPANIPSEKDVDYATKIIDAITKQITIDATSRSNFNLILAKASNGKLQVVELDAAKAKAALSNLKAVKSELMKDEPKGKSRAKAKKL